MATCLRTRPAETAGRGLGAGVYVLVSLLYNVMEGFPLFFSWYLLTCDWHHCCGHVAGWCLCHLPALLGLLCQHVEVLRDVLDGITWQGGVDVEIWVDWGREDRSTKCWEEDRRSPHFAWFSPMWHVVDEKVVVLC